MFNKYQFTSSVIFSIPPKQHYDIIVIGSGPGGAISACTLAESGKEVLLIEEGDYYDLDDMVPFSLDEMKYKYRNNGMTLSFGKPKINYVEGKCVGGGSEVNSGLYHRTPEEVLSRWKRDFELKAIENSELEPYFRDCEESVSISYNPGKLPEASLKLAEGAAKKNWKKQEIPRWFKYDGNVDVMGNSTGTKMSMTQTYIPRFLSANGRLLVKTRCLKISKIAGKINVECSQKGRQFVLNCNNIFLCAGAVHTPNILLRSGFTHNIGKSFLLHPTIKVTALFDREINNEMMGVPVHQVKEFSPDASFGCSISSPPYLGLAMNDHSHYAGLVDTDWKKMAIYYSMTNAEGKGSVSTLPFFKDPVVKYQLTEKERTNLATGLRNLCDLLLEADARMLFPSITKSRAIKKKDELSALPRMLDEKWSNLMTIHLFSSCPMGENESKCATNSFGKLYGHNNIFINDASLLPTALGVNPQGSIMAFAKRNIDYFIQNYS